MEEDKLAVHFYEALRSSYHQKSACIKLHLWIFFFPFSVATPNAFSQSRLAAGNNRHWFLLLLALTKPTRLCQITLDSLLISLSVLIKIMYRISSCRFLATMHQLGRDPSLSPEVSS